MTCREKLKLEHPEEVNEHWKGGCYGCPQSYGYLPRPDACDGSTWMSEEYCSNCWNREIPDTNSNDYITTTNEKEKNMATKKTKAELEKELETVKESKAELEKELKNLEKYKQYEDMAGEIHALYTSFVYAGFSEEQAYDLLKTMIQNASSININAAVTPSYAGYRCKK